MHSTGHVTRLNRQSITEMSEFGSDGYSKEELIAEIGSCYLSNFAGILNINIKNSTAYLDGWLQKLKNDKRFVILAAGQAQRAADYILNIPPPEEKEEVEQPEILNEE